MKQAGNGSTIEELVRAIDSGDAGDVAASLGYKAVPRFEFPGERTAKFDPIINPAHYCQGDIEPWEFIEAQRLGFHEGSAVQYITRARHKGDEIADLRKAINMLSRKVKLLEKERPASK